MVRHAAQALIALVLTGALLCGAGCSLWPPGEWFGGNRGQPAARTRTAEAPTRSRVRDLALPETPAARYHTVRKGETVSSIARRYGVEASAVIRGNRLGDGHLIDVGQRLLIPGESPAIEGVSVREWRKR